MDFQSLLLGNRWITQISKYLREVLSNFNNAMVRNFYLFNFFFSESIYILPSHLICWLRTTKILVILSLFDYLLFRVAFLFHSFLCWFLPFLVAPLMMLIQMQSVLTSWIMELPVMEPQMILKYFLSSVFLLILLLIKFVFPIF